eukprot:12856577-Ditylum_brightwellii.AAC.2
MDWMNGKSYPTLSHSLMPKSADPIVLINGSTKDVIVVLLGEKTPSPHCDMGRVASVWACFGSASHLDAV